MGEQSLPSSYSASPLARLLNYVFSSGDSIAQAGDMSDSDSTSNNDAGSQRSSEHETPKAKPKSGTVVTTAAGGTSAGAVMASNRASWEYSSSEESSGSSGFQAPRPNQTSHSSLLTTKRSGSEGGTAALRRSFAEQLLEKPNRLPRGCRPICAAVLSYWDNICGPKIEKVLLPCFKLLSGLRPLALSLFVKIDPNPTRSQ